MERTFSVTDKLPSDSIVYTSLSQSESFGMFDIFPATQLDDREENIRKYKNTNCFRKDPTCAILLKIMGFKDIKYDIVFVFGKLIFVTSMVRYKENLN